MEDIVEFSNGSLDVNVSSLRQSNSNSNQAPLILKKSPAPTKCLDLYGLTMFERCLIFLNVCIIVILLPIVFSSIHGLDKVASDIKEIKDDNLQQIKGT